MTTPSTLTSWPLNDERCEVPCTSAICVSSSSVEKLKM
jgi:hypothetical protein